MNQSERRYWRSILVRPEFLIVSAFGVTRWMHTARTARGEALVIKQREFVFASRQHRHPAAPNRSSPCVAQCLVTLVMISPTLCIATAIMTESVLSFLGLGFPPDFPTWDHCCTTVSNTCRTIHGWCCGRALRFRSLCSASTMSATVSGMRSIRDCGADQAALCPESFGKFV